MPYKVCLVNLGSSVDDDSQKKITALLGSPTGFFDAVVKVYDEKYNKAAKLVTADVSWTTSQPSVTSTELVIYFVRNSSDSVIKHMTGFKGTADASGMTFPDASSPVGSEVYVSEGKKATSVSGGLAALAFHEAMHNKLRWGDAKLHGQDGGGGLASATVSAESKLTDTNKDLMAKHLNDSVPQWTGGVTAYVDPLNGHI